METPGALHRHRWSAYSTEMQRVCTLNQLCTDLVAIRENCPDPYVYARHVMVSLLDNREIDLCLLVPRSDSDHELICQRISCLIAFDSANFKTILTREDLIDQFVEYFTRHAECSRAQFQELSGSMYIWLLKGYLYHLLPSTNDALAYVKTASWFKKTMLMKKNGGRLLRDDVYSQLSENVTDCEEDLSVFARLFRFVELILSNFTTVAVTPTPCHLLSVSHIVESYVKFVLSDVGQGEIGIFRNKLRTNQQFAHVMFPYLKRNLATLPLSEYFTVCFGILILLLEPEPSIQENPQKMQIFNSIFTRNFADLLGVITERIVNANVEVLFDRNILPVFVSLFTPEFLSVLCSMRMSATDFLVPVQDKLMNYIQMTEPRSLADESFAARFAAVVKSLVPTDVENTRRKAKDLLNLILTALSDPNVTYPPNTHLGDHFADTETSATGALSASAISAASSQSSRSFRTADTSFAQRAATTTPDYITDPWTKMYHLTPKGIDQVLRREAQFNFSRYRDKFYRPEDKSSWQCHWLADYLNEVSQRLARHPYVHYLRQQSTTQFVGPMVSLILQPASPVAGVPVYGRNIPRRPATINLKILSYYPVLFAIFIIGWNLIAGILGLIYK